MRLFKTMKTMQLRKMMLINQGSTLALFLFYPFSFYDSATSRLPILLRSQEAMRTTKMKTEDLDNELSDISSTRGSPKTKHPQRPRTQRDPEMTWK